jgi:hypothetical protein
MGKLTSVYQTAVSGWTNHGEICIGESKSKIFLILSQTAGNRKLNNGFLLFEG